jgi:hypothetical protein
MRWQQEKAGGQSDQLETDQTPEDIRHYEMMCVLEKINKNLEKMNFYWEMITNTKL